MYQDTFCRWVINDKSYEEKWMVTATSTVLIGGLVSAFLGPELAILGKDWFNTPFVGSFFLLSSCFLFYTETVNRRTDNGHKETQKP